MLSNRLVKTIQLHKTVAIRKARRFPQGGVLSPLEWSIVVDILLWKLISNTQGYADDFVITIMGKFQGTIWSNAKGLETSGILVQRVQSLSQRQQKCLSPLTNKRMLYGLKAPTFFGRTCTFSKEVKYLGVTLDRHLTWNSNKA